MTLNFATDNRFFHGIIVDTKEDNGRILYKVRIPQIHGDAVRDEDLPFVPALSPPNMFGSTFSGGAMSKGQLIQFFKGSGQGSTGFGTITGLFHPVINTDRALYGETSSLAAKKVIPLEQATRQIKLPPDLEKVLNENGVEVVKMVEKGYHSLSTLFGLSTHGTQAPLNGAKIPKSSSVPTAKTAFSSVLNGSALSQLPGQNFSIGNLMELFTDDSLTKNMPAEVKDALTSITTLSQKYTSGNFGGAGLEGKRIDPTTMAASAIKLLADAKTVDSLISGLLELLSNPELSGENGLFHFVNLPNMFGDTMLKIGMDGSVTPTNNAETIKLLESFTSLIGGFQSSSGTLFDSVPNFSDVLNRMTPENSKGISDVLSTIKNVSPAEMGNIFVRG